MLKNQLGDINKNISTDINKLVAGIKHLRQVLFEKSKIMFVREEEVDCILNFTFKYKIIKINKNNKKFMYYELH